MLKLSTNLDEETVQVKSRFQAAGARKLEQCSGTHLCYFAEMVVTNTSNTRLPLSLMSFTMSLKLFLFKD